MFDTQENPDLADIFSRCVAGWLIAPRESADPAEQLIAQTVARHDVERGMLTPHADRGASMRSKPVAALLADLDIAKSDSRPHVSDDNPYSESQFKTMKYRADFPARFGCIEDVRAHFGLERDQVQNACCDCPGDVETCCARLWILGVSCAGHIRASTPSRETGRCAAASRIGSRRKIPHGERDDERDPATCVRQRSSAARFVDDRQDSR